VSNSVIKMFSSDQNNGDSELRNRIHFILMSELPFLETYISIYPNSNILF